MTRSESASISGTAPASPRPSVSSAKPVRSRASRAADARAHLKDVERRIVEALERNRNNKAAVARELGFRCHAETPAEEYRINDDE